MRVVILDLEAGEVTEHVEVLDARLALSGSARVWWLCLLLSFDPQLMR